MKRNDTVLIRRFQGHEVWLYSRVEDPSAAGGTIRLRVTHAGNPDHDAVIFADPVDVRTKADIQALLSSVSPLANVRRLNDQQLQALGAQDGFWLQFLGAGLEKQRETIHQKLVPHYTVMVGRLS